MTLDSSDVLAWLEPILTRKREDGGFYYTNEEVAAFVPVFLISLGVDPRKLPPNVALVVARFAEDAGVRPDMTREEAKATLQAHLHKHPLNPELLFEVRRGMREERATESIEDRGRRFADAFGRSARLPTAAPQSGIRGGVLARIALDRF
jgi:hypothetical protein